MIPPDIERVALIGWHVYPCSTKSKAGMFKGAGAAASCDLGQIEAWALQYHGCNWRVVCGPSGLFALDVDRPGTHKQDGFASLADLVVKFGPLPPRPMTRTGGSGGAVLFFKHEGQPLRGKAGNPAPGLDPHRGRQAIVIPPSTHPVTRGAYTWRVPPWEVDPPTIPKWMSDLLAPPPEPEWKKHAYTPTNERARHALMKAIHAIHDAPGGQANDTLNLQALRLGHWAAAGLLDPSDVKESLMSAARQRNIPHNEARDTIHSGFTAGLKSPVQARHAG